MKITVMQNYTNTGIIFLSSRNIPDVLDDCFEVIILVDTSTEILLLLLLFKHQKYIEYHIIISNTHTHI